MDYNTKTLNVVSVLTHSTCILIYPDLAGPGLMNQHCTVEHVDGVVMLHPQHGECCINYEEVTQPIKLNQGERPEPQKKPPLFVKTHSKLELQCENPP